MGRAAIHWIVASAAMWSAAACGSETHQDPGFENLSGAGGATSATGATTATTGSTSGGTGTGGAPAGLGPPYPIVLAHGFFGFDQFAGLDFATYFYEVQEHLAEHGEVYVFTPAVDPFNSSTHRGAQLEAAIEDILATTGHDKVNIIGHSQGGLDARVVAHDRPDMVASVLTLQTPHGGVYISDIALELIENPGLSDVLDWVVQTFGAGLYDAIDGDTSISAAFQQFSTPAIEVFDQNYPDAPGVFYASIAGRSDYSLGGSACDVQNPPPFIGAWENERDPIDPLFSVTEAIIDGSIINPYPNDGLVRVVDAKHGLFLGCLPADHTDMVGHLFGDKPGVNNDWDYKQFYVDLVLWLRTQGY